MYSIEDIKPAQNPMELFDKYTVKILPFPSGQHVMQGRLLCLCNQQFANKVLIHLFPVFMGFQEPSVS